MDADMNAIVKRRDTASAQKFPAITRTGQATDVVYEGMLPGVRSLEERLWLAVQDAAMEKPTLCPAELGAVSVSACIGALLSAREGKAISLPIQPETLEGKEVWAIS
jgi:hypothetical protein